MRSKNCNRENERSCSACATDIFEERGPLWRQKKISTILIGSILLSAGLYLEFLIEQHLLAQILFLMVVAASGHSIIRKGAISLWKKRLDMNFLIGMAAAGAFLIGHGEEGAAVILLFFVAEFLEDYAAERAKKSVASLLELAPEIATVRRNRKEETLHVHEVLVGDIIIVKPGDRIPLDGTVVRGTSTVNQAPITGESMPVAKRKGSSVFAGTINDEGYLEIRATKKSDESTLSKIVKLVERAQKRKSRTEIFIDKFAKYYTPVVIVLALLVATVPSLIFGLPFEEWLYRALILLVVSCPCALAISTPISMVSGITSAARNGVLIKGGNHLEEIRKMKIMVFDKTGTLTEGRPGVTNIIPLNRYSENELLQIAASLESRSRHPIAEAIVKSAEKRKIRVRSISEFRSIAGKGLRGKINGRWFYVGNRNFFEGLGTKLPMGITRKLESEGKTAVLIGNSKHVIGVIALMDRIRPASLSTIKKLRSRGIRTIMLTGDNKRTARTIAKKLSIDEHYAELLPEDKVRIIEDLSERYEHVAMVGDGVNDAPALAKAHVGIAMGTAGSDIAIEAADIALMHDDLSKIIYLTDLSKKTMSVIRQNITASILIKGSFVALTFPGIITLWLAVAVGDMGLSLAVILNALRIGLRRRA